MGGSLELEAQAAARTAAGVGEFCRAALVGIPGGAFMSFDDELRVHFAEGRSLVSAGVGPIVGRRLPDVMPAASWKVLRGAL